jgi:hypothetical protein
MKIIVNRRYVEKFKKRWKYWREIRSESGSTVVRDK